MVGLSIVLESQKSTTINKKNPQLINKSTMIKPSPPPPPHPSSPSPLLLRHPSSSPYSLRWNNSSTTTFLDECFLCKQRLLPGKDIYMYRGDRAFCSVDCRCKHISIDEEESLKRDYSTFSTKKPTSFSSSFPAVASRHHRKGTTRNSASAGAGAGGFAY